MDKLSQAMQFHETNPASLSQLDAFAGVRRVQLRALVEPVKAIRVFDGRAHSCHHHRKIARQFLANGIASIEIVSRAAILKV